MSWITGKTNLVARYLEDPDDRLLKPMSFMCHPNPGEIVAQLAQAWDKGVRFQELNEDPGEFHRNDFMGDFLLKQSDATLTTAMEAFHQKDYDTCEKLTSKGLEAASKVTDAWLVLANLFCLRSEVRNLKGDYEKAVMDAEMSVRCYPILIKAILQLSDALKGLKMFDKAFMLCSISLNLYNAARENEIGLVKRALTMAPNVPQGFAHLFEDTKISADIWSGVIKQLADEGNWGILNILLMGTDDNPSMVSSFDAREVTLHGLLEHCGETAWTKWGQKLATSLLRHGADYKTLCKESKWPFHAALAIGLKTGSFDLLKYIFTKCGSKDYQVATNSKGDSLLHMCCRDKGAHRSTAISLLLNNGVDPGLKNRDNKQGHDLLTPGDPDIDTIKKKLSAVKHKVTASGDSLPGSGSSQVKSDHSQMAQVVVTSGACASGQTTGPLALSLQQPRLEPKYVISRDWSKTKINNWLEQNKLSSLKKKFKDMDGPQLIELKVLQETAPEAFYGLLQDGLQISLLDILRISRALRESAVGGEQQ